MNPVPPEKTPRWIIALIVGLALLQPAVHLLIAAAPPEGTKPTGLHILDSALFLQSMEVARSGFYSPYATCAEAAKDPAYYSVPHLWLYIALGAIARVLWLNPFLLYGAANGVGALLYLTVVWRLLRSVLPKHAPMAFLLFALGGGPMGVAYLVARATGALDEPEFAATFLRWAYYDLTEGPHLNPTLIFSRFYYTLSLACCLGGMTAIIEHARGAAFRRVVFCVVPMIIGSFVDARFTVFTFVTFALWLCSAHDLSWTRRRELSAHYLVPMVAGILPAWLLLRSNAAVVENHLFHANMAMWIAPFLIVAGPLLVVATPAIGDAIRRTSTPLRLLLLAGCGYLTAYLLLYLLRQGWYGQLLSARDGSVAGAISDAALLGCIPAIILARFFPRRDRDHTLEWLALWLLGFLAVSISGFGQGGFLRFGPQRLEVFLWLPLCALAAVAMASWRPVPRRAVYGVVCGLGTVSILVSTFMVHGPIGHAAARGPWMDLNPSIMSHHDHGMLDTVNDGRVIAPAPMSDVAARWRKSAVLYGIGSFNLTTRPYAELRDRNVAFFDPATPDAVRREIAESECIRWVICPDTWPVPEETIAILRATPWLEEVQIAGRGGLFLVRFWRP